MTAEWLVALEATGEPGALDVDALARRLGALGDCRPEAGSERYVVVLREPGREPLDALRGAVTRFEEAAGAIGRAAGAHLVGARLVSGKEGRLPRPNTLEGAGGSAAVATDVRARLGALRQHFPERLGLVVAAIAGLVALVTGLVWNAEHAPVRPSLSGRGQLAADEPHNVLPDGTFGTPLGVPSGAQGWGAARFSLVRRPGGGSWAQQVLVLPGMSGGMFLEAPAEPGQLYTQSLLMRVIALEPARRVEVVVEWYDDAHHLVGYHMLPVAAPDSGLVRRSQTVRAPSGTVIARFLVNATGGATYVFDEADLSVAPAGAKPTPG